MTPAPDGRPTNLFFHRTAPLQEAAEAAAVAAETLALLGALGGRGRPGRDGEPSQAEEVFVDMACPAARPLLLAVTLAGRAPAAQDSHGVAGRGLTLPGHAYRPAP